MYKMAERGVEALRKISGVRGEKAKSGSEYGNGQGMQARAVFPKSTKKCFE